jgi:hypothetical protein
LDLEGVDLAYWHSLSSLHIHHTLHFVLSTESAPVVALKFEEKKDVCYYTPNMLAPLVLAA